MKMRNPELAVVRFESEDVIATSAGVMSTADYNSYFNANYDADQYPYVHFAGGSMYGYDDNEQSWYFGTSGISHNGAGITAQQMEDWRNGNLNNIGDVYSTYDVYVKDGYAYTKGASYFELYGNGSGQ